MTKLLKKRFPGSSLTEVITAMVIISLVFSFTLTIFSNVLNRSFSTSKERGSQVVKALLNGNNFSSFSEKSADGKFVIVSKVSDNHDGKTKTIIIQALTLEGNVLYEGKKIVKV